MLARRLLGSVLTSDAEQLFLNISDFFNFVNDNFYNTFAITSVKVVEIDFCKLIFIIDFCG